VIIDRETLFSNYQAITADAASTNAVDLGASSYGRGPGNPLVVFAQVGASFNNLTSLTFQLQCDDDVAFGSPRTLTQLNVPLASLVAKARFSIPLPFERIERYLRLYYDVVGSNPGTGTVLAWLADGGMGSSL